MSAVLVPAPATTGAVVEQPWISTARVDAPPRIEPDTRSHRPQVQAVACPAGDAVEARLLVPRDLRVFDGHFPAIPLVPGMVQVAWAVELAHEHLVGVGRFRGIAAVKFRRLVRPGMVLQLSLQWLDSRRELRFEYRHDAVVVANGRLRMGGADV